jgi:hypothetical protein
VGDVLDQSIRQCPNAEEIFLLCEKHADKLNSINITTAMNHFAKFLGCFSETRPKDHARMTLRQVKTCKLIFSHAVSNVSQFDSQSLSTLVWALASLNMPSADLQDGMGVITQRVIATASCFKPLDLSDLMWGLAMLELPADKLLVKAVSDRSVRVINEFNPRQLSRLMWAIAKLKVEICIELAQAVSRRARDSIGEFKPANMSQLMWAFAKLDYFPGNELALAVLKHANSNIDGFIRQCHTSSNFLWAIDHLGIKPDPQLADALSGKLSSSTLDVQSHRTPPEPAPSSTRAADPTHSPEMQRAKDRCFMHDLASEHRTQINRSERSSDESTGPGKELGLLTSKASYCSKDSSIPLKRKRDDGDENMSGSIKSLRPSAEVGESIQKFSTPENRKVAGAGGEIFKMPEEPGNAGDSCFVLFLFSWG